MEADFARFYPATDYRDRYRPCGGASRLTIRRMLVLVDELPAESAFQSAREDRAPYTLTAAAVLDVWESVTGKSHPGRLSLTRQRANATERVERNKLIERRRREARSHNKRAVEARLRRGA